MEKRNLSIPSFIKKNIHLIAAGALCSFLVCCTTVYMGLFSGSFLLSSVFAALLSSALATVLMRRRDGARINLLRSAMISASVISALLAAVIPGAVSTVGEKTNVPATYFLSPTIRGFDKYFENKKIYSGMTAELVESAPEGESLALLTTPVVLVTIGALILATVIAWFLRVRYITDENMEFPDAVACVRVMSLGSTAHGKTRILPMGISGLISAAFTTVRETVSAVPQSLSIPYIKEKLSIDAGLALSPMLMGFGCIAGIRRGAVMLCGALIAYVAAIPVLVETGIVSSFEAADGLRLQAGAGLLLGLGLGMLLDHLLSRLEEREKRIPTDEAPFSPFMQTFTLAVKIAVFAISVILITIAGIHFLLALALIAVSYFACHAVAAVRGRSGISASSVLTGIGGCIVAVCHSAFDLDTVSLFLGIFFVSAVCATVGEHINSYKVGSALGTSPKHQLFMHVLGAAVGAVCALIAFFSLMESGNASSSLATQIKESLNGDIRPAVILLSAAVSAAMVLMKVPAASFSLGILLPFSASACFFVGSIIGVVSKKLGTRDENGVGTGLIAGECAVVFVMSLILWITGK